MSAVPMHRGVPMLTQDDEVEAHADAMRHIEACDAWQDHYDGDGEQPEGEDPAAAPYCACDTCTTREVIYAAWPRLYKAAVRLAQQLAEHGAQPEDPPAT